MKLHKTLTVAGKPYKLITDTTGLNLKAPANAVFTVIAGAPLEGIVILNVGYDRQKLQEWFVG